MLDLNPSINLTKRIELFVLGIWIYLTRLDICFIFIFHFAAYVLPYLPWNSCYIQFLWDTEKRVAVLGSCQGPRVLNGPNGLHAKDPTTILDLLEGNYSLLGCVFLGVIALHATSSIQFLICVGNSHRCLRGGWLTSAETSIVILLQTLLFLACNIVTCFIIFGNFKIGKDATVHLARQGKRQVELIAKAAATSVKKDYYRQGHHSSKL